ncbi:peptide chain release factor 1, mitochondrial-like [Anguilla rostrata]|uniref:peptide chain release factor 1, mitochondrial-like n=1 Tax=Anguilla rostrata TaxID=7938 RepID=UPI0030D09BA1
MHKLVRLSLGACSCYRVLHGVQNGARTKLLTPKPKSPMCYLSWNGRFSLKRTYCNKSTAIVDLLQQESVQRHLHGLVAEYHHITQRLENGLLDDAERRLLNRRHVELLPLVTAFQNTEDAVKDLKEVEALLQSAEEDEQMVELLTEEQAHIEKRIDGLRNELLQSLIPSDVHDTNDVILEVVAGRTTGGDICQQFTREVFDMYQSFSSYKNWEFELLNYTPAEYGGLHHAAARISGDTVYKHLKYEGGTHRVQRIPEIGLSSRMERIHTGTMTVIVLPQPSKIDISIDPKELRIDTFRSKGAGGQSVNTTDSAVRITHIPTGMTAECQQSRSQLQNRDTAMRVLRARIYQQMLEQEGEQRHSARRLQVGTRSQSERIRSYNFSQNRVTDHRTGYMSRDIKEFLRGGEALDELIAELMAHADREALLQLLEHGGPTGEGKARGARTLDS